MRIDGKPYRSVWVDEEDGWSVRIFDQTKLPWTLEILRLTDEEKARYREQLSAVLDYMARLRQVDTSGLAPTASVLPLHSVLRADEPRPSLDAAVLLANAPAAAAQMFRVPPVLE